MDEGLSLIFMSLFYYVFTFSVESVGEAEKEGRTKEKKKKEKRSIMHTGAQVWIRFSVLFFCFCFFFSLILATSVDGHTRHICCCFHDFGVFLNLAIDFTDRRSRLALV